MQRLRRLALLLLPSLDHFTGDLLARLPAASGWEVRPFMVTGPSTLAAALDWTDQPERDAIWFEFCWPPFPAWIGATEFGARRVIVRVHRIEAAETSHVANTPWAKVSDVIVVSPDMAERVLAQAPEIGVTSRLHHVPNGVNIERFAPLGDWNRFRIGWCGLMVLRKNPILALHILARLREIDSRYHMSLCGMGGEALAHETFLHLARRLDLLGAIRWEGRISQADIGVWHSANGVLLHTSLHESFGYAIAEAAACGCDIAVFDHPGAAATWPSSVLFGTVDEAASLIHTARPHRWRDHIHANFSLDQQITAISTLLNQSKI
jgi:glycosyltransferase involved in cell wall biosynthesis